jgi:predicted PurR-regulated permease PerM
MDGVTGEAMDGDRAATPDRPAVRDNVLEPVGPVSAGDPEGYAPGATDGYHRDRLLAAMTLTLGLGLLVALPFALREGADFFLPLTAALVAAVALVPPLEWLERRGLPSGLSAFLCLLLVLGLATVAIASVVVPAANWVALLPQRIGRIRATLRPLVEVYASLNGFIDKLANTITITKAHARAVTIETPDSLLSLLTSSAPGAFLQFLFGVLLIFFFLAGWSTMRRRSITRRASFNSAMTLARVIQEVVDATSSYIATITFINVGLGCIVAIAVGLVGLPTPLMWGGLVTLLNYVPYLGPIAGVLLLGLGGLITFADPWTASVPALIFIGLHLIEANIVTPTIVGRRLTINPLLILVAISFWGWVWGTIGAVLAVPLLVITRTVLDAAGRPDIAGFLFEYGTLASGTRRRED